MVGDNVELADRRRESASETALRYAAASNGLDCFLLPNIEGDGGERVMAMGELIVSESNGQKMWSDRTDERKLVSHKPNHSAIRDD
jgi:hypothetical protein